MGSASVGLPRLCWCLMMLLDVAAFACCQGNVIAGWSRGTGEQQLLCALKGICKVKGLNTALLRQGFVLVVSNHLNNHCILPVSGAISHRHTVVLPAC